MLAGGAASRFGARPKGLATVAGQRVVDRVAAVLREATDDLLLVANDPAADAWLPGTRRVADVRAGLGPLGGIHAALAHSANAILVVAWDMPFVNPALLAELRRVGQGDCRAVVPESVHGRLEPTCALYAPACRPALEDWLDSGRSGAAAFLMRCGGVCRLPAAAVARFGDPARLFFSVNTPAALEQAETLAALS
ncbi:MAG: molybdenum cofactor guanylyltransferase [Gemmatimonadaceae bacterium]